MSDVAVEFEHGLPGFSRDWPKLVTRIVSVAEIQSQKRRPLRARQIKPLERSINSRKIRKLFIVDLRKRKPLARLAFGSGIEDRSRLLPLLFGSPPDWLAQPPAAALNFLAISQCKNRL